MSISRAAIILALPSKTRPSAASAAIPCPGTASNETIGGSASPRALASPTMASPSGCSEPCSAAAASANNSSAVTPATGTTSVTTGLPTVSVPVLSRTTIFTRWSRSSASALRMRTPSCAPLPVPTMMAVGVANPMAQGQAMTRTPTAFVSAWTKAGAGPQPHQIPNVTAAMARIIGTNTEATRSARRWIGAFDPCASSTSPMIRASTVSLPTCVARNVKLPVRLMDPPTTVAPGPFSSGRLSPVSIDSSTVDAPSTT